MREVLIVDDDPVHAEIAEMSLKRAGYRVRRASDGPLGLEALAADPLPDLVLLDVMLPKLDGFEVLRRLRADARTKDLPVIMVTSMSRDQDAARGRALGANDYIVKPLMDADFLRRVRTAIKLDSPGS
ncbi:MAG TPA: response regulator [Burkholderiales bacterium]